MGETLFFPAAGGLWRSDGTEAGTVRVKNISHGYTDPAILTPVGDALFFTADDGRHGLELWKSDGTRSGTVMVKDIEPGARGYNYEYHHGPEGLDRRRRAGSSSPLPTESTGGAVGLRRYRCRHRPGQGPRGRLPAGHLRAGEARRRGGAGLLRRWRPVGLRRHPGGRRQPDRRSSRRCSAGGGRGRGVLQPAGPRARQSGGSRTGRSGGPSCCGTSAPGGGGGTPTTTPLPARESSSGPPTASTVRSRGCPTAPRRARSW